MNETINEIIINANMCSICLNENIDEAHTCVTGCNHEFCEECIIHWFDSGKDSCPICRERIKEYTINGINAKIIRINQNVPSGNINGIPSLLVIQNLIRLNYKLKCISYFLILSLIFTVQQIYSDSHVNHKIRTELADCQLNLTHLSELTEYNEFNHVLMYNSEINTVHNCLIPSYFYDKCFP
jgi:hypothetical protein